MDLRCPKCGAENTQRLSLLVSGGTLSTDSTVFGVGGAFDEPDFGIGGAFGETKSGLAEIHAAPQRRSVFWAPILITALGAALTFPLGAWVVWLAAVFAVWRLFSAAIYNIRSHPPELGSVGIHKLVWM